MDYEDFDDEIELEGDADEWDGDALGLEWDEAEAQSIVKDLGITSASGA